MLECCVRSVRFHLSRAQDLLNEMMMRSCLVVHIALVFVGSATALRLGAKSGLSRRQALLSGAAAAFGVAHPPALADDGIIIGQIPASGIIFKDIVKVERVADPKVKGVDLYISDFQRPITDRLSKDFFSDPTQAAVTCVKTGKVELADDIDMSQEGEEVFQQARSLLFKSVNVRRLYDKETDTLIYVSYSTRLNKSDDENKSRFKTTMCAIKAK